MNFYILIFLTAFFSSMIVLNAVKVLGQEVGDSLNEDQAVICIKDVWSEDPKAQGNEKVACKTISTDNYFKNSEFQKLYNEFMQESDTYNLSDLTGMID